MKRYYLFALTAVASMNIATAKAQYIEPKDNMLFNHLDLSLTAGTTGLGFDLSTTVGEYARLRTGFSFMPRFEIPMHFDVQVGDDPSKSEAKFNKLASKLEVITGHRVSPDADVTARPKMWNWNVLVDVMPFRQNKHWRFTAGFYLGPSKVGEAYNTTECMQTLMAVSIFNNMYDMIVNSPILTDENYFFDNTVEDVIRDIDVIRDLGILNGLSFPESASESYFDPDDNPVKSAYQKVANYGRMGVQMGKYARDIVDEKGNVVHKKGDTYLMEPDENSMVKASMHVNSFKPYFGFGYEGRLVKGDDRYHISFDCGVMMWGGTPHLETHDGTDLIHDVEDIPGKVGDYVNAAEKFKVFPVLNIRLTRKLF